MTTYLMTFIDHNGDYYQDFQTGERTKKILEGSDNVIVISCEKVGEIA